MPGDSPLRDSWLIESESTAICRYATRHQIGIHPVGTEANAVLDCVVTANALCEPVRLYQYRENSTLKIIGKALPSMDLIRKRGRLFGPYVFWRVDDETGKYFHETTEDVEYATKKPENPTAPAAPHSRELS